jgi:hypothetical protein
MRTAARRVARTAAAALSTTAPPAGWATAWAPAATAGSPALLAIGGARALQHASSSSSTDIRAVMAEKIPVQQVRDGGGRAAWRVCECACGSRAAPGATPFLFLGPRAPRARQWLCLFFGQRPAQRAGMAASRDRSVTRAEQGRVWALPCAAI